MKTSLFVIIIGIAFGVVVIGALSTNIMLNAQNFEVLGSIADILGGGGTFVCECEDPDNPGQFGDEFCEFGPGDPHQQSEMICTGQTTQQLSLTSFSLFSEEEYYGEGCGVSYWKDALGYDPSEYSLLILQTSQALAQEASQLNQNADTEEKQLAALFADELALVGNNMKDIAEDIVYFGNQENKDSMAMAVLEMEVLYDRMKTDTLNIPDFVLETANLAENLMQYGQIMVEQDPELSSWPSGYEPSFSYNQMFQTSLILDSGQAPTMLEALNAEGGGVNQLARESVAAMLNAAHDDVKYKYSVVEVMEIAQNALIGQDYTLAISELSQYNNLGNSLLCSKP